MNSFKKWSDDSLVPAKGPATGKTEAISSKPIGFISSIPASIIAGSASTTDRDTTKVAIPSKDDFDIRID